MNSRLEKLKGFESFADESERKDSLRFLEKIADADQHGAFQHFQSNVTEYATRERYLSQRGGEPPERTTEGLYNLSPDHGDSYVPEPSVATHLSTRYSPDRVGVQALRVSDGVFQDPYTNKIYDYNEGFKAEDGRTFPPGSAALQSSMMHMANHLDQKGLVKEANYLDSLIKKAAGGYVSVGGPNPDDALSTEEIGKLFDLGWRRDDFADVDRSTPSVREALGLDSSGASARENRPLTTAELASLFEAHEDPSSDYKLTSDRLRDVNNSNLTDEEVAILDVGWPLVGTASKLVNNLITFSTHLDENGLTKEADYLDSLIKKTKE